MNEVVHAAGRGAIAAMAMTGMRAVDRAGLAADHLLYGLVLSETRARPREALA
ncbi:MAG: hypothetical protein ABW135_15445 [Thermoleophilaceae bacterium]